MSLTLLDGVEADASIVHANHRLTSTQVCADCLSDYLVETLRTLRSHFRGGLALDSRESLRETLNGVNCTALDLREFAAGRRHVPSPIPPASAAPAAHEDPACLALVNIAFPPRLKQD